jgi:hypothetical protein
LYSFMFILGNQMCYHLNVHLWVGWEINQEKSSPRNGATKSVEHFGINTTFFQPHSQTCFLNAKFPFRIFFRQPY